jgi:O-antigen/teichoic acid export membrane protein
VNRVSRRSSYRHGLGFAALSTVALAVVGLASAVIVARAFGIEALGQFTLAIAPGLALTFLSTAKEQTALIRELAVLPPRAPRVAGLFYATFAFSVALTALVGLLTLGVAWLVFNGPVDHPDLLPLIAADLAVQVVVVNTCFNLDSVLIAYRAGRELFWARLLQALAFPVLAVACSFVSHSAWWLVAATGASWVVALGFRLAVVPRYMPVLVPVAELRAGLRALPEMVRFGLKLAPGGIAAGASSQLGVWVLGAIGSVSQVGAYGRAWTLSSRLLTANTRISEMLLPTLVERREQRDRVGFDRALGESMRYAMAGLLLPAAVGGGAATGVMQIFGPGFDQGAGALAILLLVPALAALLGIQGQTLPTAIGKPGTSTLISLSRAAVTLALTIPLTLWLGASGTALAFVAGSAALLPVTVWLARRHVSGGISRWYGPRDLVATGAAYAAGFLTAHTLDGALGGFAGTALALVAGSGAYATAFLLCGGVRSRDRDRLREVLARRPLRGPLAGVGAR